MDKPIKTLSSELKYDNPWITVTEHQVVYPNNFRALYGKVHFKNIAIGILPIDEQGFTWLVGQYRYPIDCYSWEIPAGGGKVGEDILGNAKRELKEETGIQAEHWTNILETYLSNSVTNERSVSYLATGLSFGEAAPELDEDLALQKMPFRQAYQKVLRGEITDAFSILTLLKAGTLPQLRKWVE